MLLKDIILPKTVDSNSFVVTTSISGNTEETLISVKKCKKMKCKIIAFSSGGKMEKFCKKIIKFRKISKIHSPRASFPEFFFSMLKKLRSENHFYQ